MTGRSTRRHAAVQAGWRPRHREPAALRAGTRTAANGPVSHDRSVEGGDPVSPKTGGTAEGPTFRPGWTVGHIAGATRTVPPVAPSSADTAQATLAVVARGESLGRDQAREFMSAVLDGDVTPAQLGGVLLAVRVRTETTDELAGFVEAMRARVLVFVRPRAPSTPVARVAMSMARSTSRPRPRS